ncbi:MAG TPA: DUF4255 domain-containing protein [Nitrospira sp.]|nr:DUF4255 domain-containing protein [Nitrospira sp.]
MSNYLAIGAVTATLRYQLQNALDADPATASAKVTNARPDGTSSGMPSFGVNVYLYQMTPNPSWRNADLPTRNSSGALVQRPRAAFDLHYLLSCYGDEAQFEPQRVLGVVVRTLHTQALLTHKLIQTALADPMFAVLAASDLADEVELVKFTPSPLNLEELSKLWSVFFQTPYHLSVAYQGSVVFIEPDDRPQPTLPVLDRDVYVLPVSQPVIEGIASDAGPGAPIVATDTLIISGKRLRADAVTVLVGGVPVTPQPGDISNTRISIPLPGGVQAGVVAVQVAQPMMMGRPPEPHHGGAESNVAAFVLHPTITPGPVTSSLVTLTVNPPVVQGQPLVLLLNERATTAPKAYSFTSKQPATGSTVQISISGVKPAEYFVRLQVDGAESPVDLDPNSLKFGPKVTIP